MFKRPESVLVVVYTAAGEVLLLRRRQPKGYWQSVTGSLEWREHPLQAAHRELYEETRLHNQEIVDCRQSEFFTIYPVLRHLYAPGATQNLEHVFRIRLDARRFISIEPHEHDTYRWSSKAEALDLVISYTNRNAIERWVTWPKRG